jgi:hypothetical protein
MLTFRLDSAELVASRTVRAHFTRVPNTATTGPHSGSTLRADVIANWTLSGPQGAVGIQAAGTTTADAQAIDLTLFQDLPQGSYSLGIASTVESAGTPFFTVVSPLVVTLQNVVLQQDSLTSGATNSPGINGGPSYYQEAENTLNSFLSSAFRGKPNWSAYIAGLARGDAAVREQAVRAAAQLYIVSASQTYLTRRAADNGVSRPRKTGMVDETFRKLVVSVLNSKLTQGAMLGVLEAFYGTAAVTAVARTAEVSPFSLFDGADLRLLIDEKFVVDVVFKRANCRTLTRATADEVAAAITKAISFSGSNGYAVAAVNPISGDKTVEIYSGTKGLGSSVRVLKGTAQGALQLPTNAFNPPLPLPALPSWTFELRPQGKVRLHCTTESIYSFSVLEPGDYVVVLGPEFGAANSGSFVIEDVYYAYSGGVLDQWVEYSNASASGVTAAQVEYASMEFFKPEKTTVYDSTSYAVVSQREGVTAVSVAATSSAVNRDIDSAAYLHNSEPLTFSSYIRDDAGTVTVTTVAPHGLLPGDHFSIDGLRAEETAPPQTGAAASAAWGAETAVIGTAGLSSGTAWNRDNTFEGSTFQNFTDLDGDLWFWGGNKYNSGVETATNKAAFFRVDSKSVDAQNRRTYSYRWSQATVPANFNLGVAPAVVDDPSAYNSVALCGGYLTTPWAAPSGATKLQATIGKSIKISTKEVALATSQFSNTEGLRAALAIWLTTQPVSGDLITITTGGTTRTYGFVTGGNVTVALGGTVALTQANLATAIAGDGPAAWTAENCTSLGAPFPNSSAVVISEKTVAISKSSLRVFGNAGIAAKTQLVSYADNFQATHDYTTGTTTALPTGDPGQGRAGFHRDIADLLTGETHEVLNTTTFRSWNGTAWTTVANWATITNSSGVLQTPTAEAAALWMTSPVSKVFVSGGLVGFNKAHSVVQSGLFSVGYTAESPLKAARCQHAAIKLGPTTFMVIGGRQPAADSKRAGLGYTSWSFEDAVAGASFTGPVDVARSGNVRIGGKIGHGIQLSVATSSASAGAPQTSLNSALLGSWTISGWMTAGTGCVFRNGISGAWSVANDNTLVSFGVDTSDDKFFLRYMTGSGVLIEKKTTQTRAALMGVDIPAPYPRYHHFAITKQVVGGTADFRMYINGVQAGYWNDVLPTAGVSGLWSFSQADGGISRFTGCIDEVGFTSTVLSAQDVWEQFTDEVGVVAENPGGLDISPVGRVLNSCEIVTTGGSSVFTGPMSYARFGAGVVKLPDGRILALGGIGYNPSTDGVAYNKSQRQLELRSAEVYNPSLRCWTPLPDMTEAHSWPAVAYSARTNRVYIAGGFASKKTEYLDLKTMKWGVSTAEFPVDIEKARGGGGFANGDVLVLGGADVKAGGQSFVLDTAAAAGAGFSLTPSSETTWAGGINGVFTATQGTSGNTVVFKTPNHAFWTSATSPDVLGATLTSLKAPAADGIPGPYVFSPQEGFAVTSTSGILQARVEKGRKYSVLTLGSNEALKFPRGVSYVVVRWGRSNQVGPLKCLGPLSSNTIAIDSSFTFPFTAEVGAEVRALSSRAPYVPEAIPGTFWLTAANSGRVAAIQMLKDISASGIDLDFDVRYPGDVGLGGEGRPTSGSYKISDIVGIFGSDNLDEELEVARNA